MTLRPDRTKSYSNRWLGAMYERDQRLLAGHNRTTRAVQADGHNTNEVRYARPRNINSHNDR